MKMIGILMPKRLSSACRSKPLNRGSLMSKTRQLGTAGSGCCSNSVADANASNGTKQAAQPAEHERIIVDNEYDRSSAADAGEVGRAFFHWATSRFPLS